MKLEDCKCDVCGAPASSACKDVRETAPQGDYECWEPFGPARFGCAEHPVASKEHRRISVVCHEVR